MPGALLTSTAKLASNSEQHPNTAAELFLLSVNLPSLAEEARLHDTRQQKVHALHPWLGQQRHAGQRSSAPVRADVSQGLGGLAVCSRKENNQTQCKTELSPRRLAQSS